MRDFAGESAQGEQFLFKGVSADLVRWFDKSQIVERFRCEIPDLDFLLFKALAHPFDAERNNRALQVLEKLWVQGPLFGPFPPLRLLDQFQADRRFYHKYRDHVSHTLKVFLLGLMVYEECPSMKTQVEKEIGGEQIFLNAWLVTAVYHDLGYLMEHGDGNNPQSEPWLETKKQLNTLLEAPLCTVGHFKDVLSYDHEKRLNSDLGLHTRKILGVNDLEGDVDQDFWQLLARGVENCGLAKDHDNSEALKKYYQYAQSTQPVDASRSPFRDHGITSALMLLKIWSAYRSRLDELGDLENDRLNDRSGRLVRDRARELGTMVSEAEGWTRHAAVAVCLHNIDLSLWNKDDLLSFGVDPDGFDLRLNASEDECLVGPLPLAFLLALADELQDWGRQRFDVVVGEDDNLTDSALSIVCEGGKIQIAFRDDSVVPSPKKIRYSQYNKMINGLNRKLNGQEVDNLVEWNSALASEVHGASTLPPEIPLVDLSGAATVGNTKSGTSVTDNLDDKKLWMVSEARTQREFREAIAELQRNVIEVFSVALGDDPDIAITVYSRDRDLASGVSSFEYDLLCYINLYDPPPMFGPIIRNDARLEIASAPESFRVSFVEGGSPGSFADREGVKVAGWFKLGLSHWAKENPIAVEVPEEETTGLVFVNVRQNGISRHTFREPRIIAALSQVEMAMPAIVAQRRKKKDERCAQLFLSTGDMERALPSHDVTDLPPNVVGQFLKKLRQVYDIVFKDKDTAVTIYQYDRLSERLNWLWSSGPTDASCSYDLSGLAHEEWADMVLPIRIAMDPGHKPLLIHDLQHRKEYRDRCIRTIHGDSAKSTLVAPVLATNESKELLGVIDFQRKNAGDFDADAMQLIYEITERYLAKLLARLAQQAKKEGDKSYPLRNADDYRPFLQRPLQEDIRQILALDFSSMKYLLYWDKVRAVVTGEGEIKPALVEVWPSMSCNHSCRFCRTFKDRMRYSSINTYISGDRLASLARDCRELDAAILISGGGEPLMNSELTAFMAELSDYKETVGIFTNGSHSRSMVFWEQFFSAERAHRFVRVSVDSSSPEEYYDVHFGGRKGEVRPPNYRLRYAEMRKSLLDLLGMRGPLATVAVGSTIENRTLNEAEAHIQHARRMGVDFIQMRPELFDSAEDRQIGEKICRRLKKFEQVNASRNEFPVKYTDDERAMTDHDYPHCQAMYLVPAVLPDRENDWLTVLPCSYTQTQVHNIPKLGRMKAGGRFTEFWQLLCKSMHGDKVVDDDQFEGIRRQPIDATACPQCRYYWLNKRIVGLQENVDEIHLIDELVSLLKQGDRKPSVKLKERIGKVWTDRIVDVAEAENAFSLSSKLGYRPTL